MIIGGQGGGRHRAARRRPAERRGRHGAGQALL